MTSATGLFQLLLSPLLSRSAMAFFLLLFFLCTVLFFKSRGRPTLHLVSGLLALAEKLGLRRDQVMAVGDSGNDLSMIEDAGLGVAMGNATPEILAVADAVTADNNHDGVALAIEKYALHR